MYGGNLFEYLPPFRNYNLKAALADLGCSRPERTTIIDGLQVLILLHALCSQIIGS
jgi:hypothetical protein